jgi:hypothetical protein
MVAIQENFPWYEEVRPPDNPDKTVHVRNHWRRPPRSAVPQKKDDPEVTLRIVSVSSPERA